MFNYSHESIFYFSSMCHEHSQKPFVIKNGVETDQMELYLRCSIQDYFIKLCESNVAREDLELYLNKGITVEMEIVDGEWDRCPGDPVVQSRIGKYVTIKSIVD